jgi:[acyl-carrier-protein] S-malonyltransferase
VVAGHSVGELAAAAIAGVFPALDAVDLAAVRGTAMSAACALTPTGMSAVMGGDTEVVLAALAELDLVGANVNGGGQIVAAGPLDALDQLKNDPPSGTRIIPLPVAGAFHTSFMASAEEALAAQVVGIATADPVHPLLTNSDGSVVSSGQLYLNLLVGQVVRPVRWDLCMETLRTMGVTGVLELPPAGTLVGLVKRDLKGVATMALKSPADLDSAKAFAAEHAGVLL